MVKIIPTKKINVVNPGVKLPGKVVVVSSGSVVEGVSSDVSASDVGVDSSVVVMGSSVVVGTSVVVVMIIVVVVVDSNV